MPKFKIFAGLSGGFGGPNYHGTYEYPNRNEAMKDAYDLAFEEYESYGGYHGLMTWDDVYQDLMDSGFIDTIDENEIAEISKRYDDKIKTITKAMDSEIDPIFNSESNITKEYKKQEDFIVGETKYVESALDNILGNIKLPFDTSIQVDYNKDKQKHSATHFYHLN